jgi:hypothetical protein
VDGNILLIVHVGFARQDCACVPAMLFSLHVRAHADEQGVKTSERRAD